ncbi:ABC transporter permease subunit [Pannonibacter tanglangensis]|uniref:ABC transporter permease subunit n=1 Tax=Pannonibacter tanglangensis TaxID=2750084 RepID=A0ABW9ZIL6_9HYPH|nr:ABC transporter permease subunit [Pannonibacter sp. XCT-34]
MRLRPVPGLVALVLAGPIALGLVWTGLPALGILPAAGATGPSLAPFAQLLETPGLARSVLLSLCTGLAATALSLALVLVLLAGWLDSAPFTGLRRLLSPLLAVPHAAAALGLALVIAPSGLLIRLAAPFDADLARPPDWLILQDPLGLSLVLGLVLKEVPFLLLMALAGLNQIDAQPRMRLAQSLGYGRVAGFCLAVAPPLYRQMRLPVLAVLAFSTSVVDMALILGPTLPPTLAVQVTRWMGDPDLALRLKGAAGAVLQLGVSLAAIAVWIAGERLAARLWRTLGSRGVRARKDGIVRGTVLALVAALALLALAGLAALVLWSVAAGWRYPDLLPARIVATHWLQAAPDLGTAISTTLAAGLAASLVAGVLVVALLQDRQGEEKDAGHDAERADGRASRWLDRLMFLPLLVPQVAFLFGLQVLFLDIGLDGSLPAVMLAHLVFVLPYVFLSLRDPWSALDPRFEQVATSLGASRARVFWRIRLPLMLPALATALALGLAVSVSLYLPTLLIGGGRVVTLTTEAVALASGGNRPLIAVHALMQLLLPCLAFAAAALAPRLLLPRLHGRRPT